MECRFISLGKCSRFYLYILGSVIFKFLESLSLGYQSTKDIDKYYSFYNFIPVLWHYNLIKSLYSYLGYILFGIIFFYIFSNNNKKEASSLKDNIISKGIIHNKVIKKEKNIKFKLFIFCLFFVLHIEIKKILYNFNFQAFNIWTFDIFFILIIMKKNFKIYYFKHQKYAIIFIIITTAFMLIASSFFPFTKKCGEYINSYKAAKEKGKSYFISIPLILFFILLSFIYSYARVTGKLLMQIHFVSPYTLIFYVGILGFIFTICTSLISHID